ncbi:MAG: hypothetical protein JWQ43_1625 [Glaciihabitans sp.]|nr:hypothetical protein [Glaciihabitans sp.]
MPHGRVIADDDGLELVVERTVEGSAAEVWDWLTLSQLTEKWIGVWTGTPGVGKVIEFTMTAEPGAEPEQVTILVCDRHEYFLADLGNMHWRVGFTLAEAEGHTLIFFTQRLENVGDAASIGPGWEYYLDRMIAARAGTPAPVWEDYYPAFASYYSRVASAPS